MLVLYICLVDRLTPKRWDLYSFFFLEWREHRYFFNAYSIFLKALQYIHPAGSQSIWQISLNWNMCCIESRSSFGFPVLLRNRSKKTSFQTEIRTVSWLSNKSKSIPRKQQLMKSITVRIGPQALFDGDTCQSNIFAVTLLQQSNTPTS
jgi:hypothetical protein